MKPLSSRLRRRALFSALVLCLSPASSRSQLVGLEDLPRLSPSEVKAANALWIETPMTAQFKSSKRVVLAELKGPAVITMLHFALPQSHFGQPVKLLNRDLLLRVWWDGEREPSVDVPLVDFFCDPNGLRESVNTALVNKRRGFNAYFPMPFRKTAKVELVYDGSVEPGDELWRLMPCYSYVLYRTEKTLPTDTAYFHASWRQEGLPLGRQDYLALQAKGRGKFVGWNVTVRQPGRGGYPVDENAKFFVDGETNASVELQGIEDAFGFSWGFPETENLFPLAGYFPFYKGAAAYRFFVPDAINFQQTLRVAIGFGLNEDPMFRREFSKEGNTLQLSSTVYWYQAEPHAPLPMMPVAEARGPAPEEPFWPHKEKLSTADELKTRGVKLQMLCGRSEKELIFAEPGYAAVAKTGYAWDGWGWPVYHARAGKQEVEMELTVPQGSAGTVRVYAIDPDNFEGGRKQTLSIAGEDLGVIEKFQDGHWLERRVDADKTSSGKVFIRATNARKGSNAVISIVEWVETR
jgi:hypothetical protein